MTTGDFYAGEAVLLDHSFQLDHGRFVVLKKAAAAPARKWNNKVVFVGKRVENSPDNCAEKWFEQCSNHRNLVCRWGWSKIPHVYNVDFASCPV